MSEGAHKKSEFDQLVENIVAIMEQQDSQIYSKRVIEEFRDPANVGRLENANGMGIADGLCNDTMEITVRIEDGRIEDARFYTDGCGATIACGSLMTKRIIGRTVDEARSITPQEMIEALGGLPEEHVHCATLTVMAVRNAIRNYDAKKASDGA